MKQRILGQKMPPHEERWWAIQIGMRDGGPQYFKYGDDLDTPKLFRRVGNARLEVKRLGQNSYGVVSVVIRSGVPLHGPRK